MSAVVPGESPSATFKGNELAATRSMPICRVALLTGGDDKPYVLGLVKALTSQGILFDVIGSDDLNVLELISNPGINFLNLRGDQRQEASLPAKGRRILKYYIRLIHYAAIARPKLLHILWNNKFEIFDRTVLMLYYKLLRKKIALTTHNVNAGKRDSKDSFVNRFSLCIQYRLADHIFVHTDKMKQELMCAFGVSKCKITVIPFGINSTVPESNLSSEEAKRRLGLSSSDKTMLFFGQIAPYKGLEYLVNAFGQLLKTDKTYRLVIAGKPKWSNEYWNRIREMAISSGIHNRMIERIEHVPDEETELYFKAADVLILPYTEIFQSGVLFLGYNFGLPAVAADVGSLREEIVEGETGFIAKPQDPADLSQAISRYFTSDLYRDLEERRPKIKKYANDRYSWSKVAAMTTNVYSSLLAGSRSVAVKEQSCR